MSSIGWFSNRVLIAAFSLSLALQVAAVYWPPLQALLRTVPLAAEHWGMIAAFALPLIVLPEGIKAVMQARAREDEERLTDA